MMAKQRVQVQLLVRVLTEYHARLSQSGKKNFSMADYLDARMGAVHVQDEVRKYKVVEMFSTGLKHSTFVEDDFDVARFWFHKK